MTQRAFTKQFEVEYKLEYLLYGRKRSRSYFRCKKAGSFFFLHFRMPQKCYDSHHFLSLFLDLFAFTIKIEIGQFIKNLVYDSDGIF